MAWHSPSIDWRETRRPRVSVWLLAFLATLLIAPTMGLALASYWPVAFQENGLIETPQMALLALTAALFAQAYIRSRNARAVFSAVMLLAALLALQREIPACESPFYEGGVCATRPAKTLFSAGAVTACVILGLMRITPWRGTLDLRNLAWVWPVALAAVLLGLAEVAEHEVLVHIEETLELGAYLYLAVFAADVAFQRPSSLPNATRDLRPLRRAPRSHDANKTGTLPETAG
ncbi:hypothetical protein [Aureimonas sp. AU4]|uniref:hypothetical protein n=1 Tax=Aureimonas sp. AU4 TaxID=1638163 RepID=UPI000784E8A5|nr:hypothetical protein [Aureimonas sp. AU4]